MATVLDLSKILLHLQNGIQTLHRTELEALEYETEKPGKFISDIQKSTIKKVFLRKMLKATETPVINRK
jgi:hypothetical protein